MNKELKKQINKLTPEQRSLLLKKIKLELAKKDLAYFVKMMLPEFDVKDIKESLKRFDRGNRLIATFQGKSKFVTIIRPLESRVKSPENGLFIIDDEIAEQTPEQRELLRSKGGVVKYLVFGENTVEIDNPTQEQLATQWEWSSDVKFAQRWDKDDLCGKMLEEKV